jgi:hypothetical protein
MPEASFSASLRSADQHFATTVVGASNNKVAVATQIGS